MATLDEFLKPLHQGVLEVPVPKEAVTEPLDPGWEKSSINMPSPGMVASYRKGQYHVHETTTEYRVHLARYDPKQHPVMHLVDDAPFITMITDTLLALVMETRGTGDTQEILTVQKKAWQLEVLIGSVVILVGALILSDPRGAFYSLFLLLVPLLIIGLGILMVIRGIRYRAHGGISWGTVTSGLGICFIGWLASLLPVHVWIIVILAILAVWGLASAIASFLDVRKAKKGVLALPEGLYYRLALGIISLVLTVLVFLAPVRVVLILTQILGIIAIVLGITLIVNGVRLRERMRNVPGS
ncbi:MAG: DUF308 domain-containing protein [Methanomicrobiales archaeon]|nr:DUF308 domain-containing protein [Methanomicrobiales archaeon]